MEIEMKFSIPSREEADSVWEEAFVSPYTDNSTAEKVIMKAVYYDTEDRLLSKNNIAFRVRGEGDLSFATLKWGISEDGGLHQRGEINIPVYGEENFIQPPVDLFKEIEEGRFFTDLIEGHRLVNILEMRFLRRRMKVHYGQSIIELAVDTGNIMTDAGQVPICEAELELYLGETDDVIALGQMISEKHGLVPENTSKLARGLALLALED